MEIDIYILNVLSCFLETLIIYTTPPPPSCMCMQVCTHTHTQTIAHFMCMKVFVNKVEFTQVSAREMQKTCKLLV